jgi:hypothetical protein
MRRRNLAHLELYMKHSSNRSKPINDERADVPSGGRKAVPPFQIALLDAGIIARVDWHIMALGNRYQRWLEKQVSNVFGTSCPANKHQYAHSEELSEGAAS